MELCSVTTADTVRLHGMYVSAARPGRAATSKGSVDAAILVHGIGGNFYSSRLLLYFSDILKNLGISNVLINTRGHDMINTVSWGGRSQSAGSAFEEVDHCRHDLNAWHDFLLDRGHANILFLGHSLGAVKSLYTAARQPPSHLRSIIALSPSRLSYQRMLETSTDGLFQETMDRCHRLVHEGNGSLPIQVSFPVKTWMTPTAYINKYGQPERYNWLNFIAEVSVPSLLVFGQKELDEHPAFLGMEQELRSLETGWSTSEIQIIADADHFYTSKYEAVDDLVTRWLIH